MPYQQNSGDRLNRVLSEQSNLLRLALALLEAVGALYIGEHIYLGEYLTTDENSYMFQAWIFLQGKFSLSCPPLEDAFFHRMIICDDQAGWVSRYPPACSVQKPHHKKHGLRASLFSRKYCQPALPDMRLKNILSYKISST